MEIKCEDCTVVLHIFNENTDNVTDDCTLP